MTPHFSLEPRPFPTKRPHAGRYVRLEPLDVGHAPALAACARVAPGSFTFLRYGPIEDEGAMRRLVAELAGRRHQPFWAVIPEGAGTAMGWLSLCDIYPDDAAIEIGSIWFSPAMQGTRAASEAVILLMREAFDALGYERLVWRHQAQNRASAAAAARYGFTYEGTWRRAATFKGARHDVVWRSILASEWPVRRHACEAWLDPANFDADGRQRAALAALRAALTPPAPE